MTEAVVGVPGELTPGATPAARSDLPPAPEQRWQWVLLPVLVSLIVGVTVFFLWATKSQLDALQAQIYSAPRVRVDSMFAAVAIETAGWNRTDRMAYTQWRTLAELEARALDRRYHQANVLLMARTWTRYLGFVTGMIMALMGAGFILGKFREAGTALDVKSAPLSAALSTTSPGLFLAALGTALMVTTILVHNPIEARDVPMYTGASAPATAATVARPFPYPTGSTAAPPTPDQVVHGLGAATAADSGAKTSRRQP